QFGALAALGQPQNIGEWLVVLEGEPVRLNPIEPAPAASSTRPGHDLPALRFGEPVTGVVPLTFDMYVALRLRAEGCQSSSLPASVRAALDRLKQLHAGSLCRDERRFASDRAAFRIDDLGTLTLDREGGSPVVRE